MSEYRWTGDGAFHDHRNDRTVEEDDVVELDEDVADGHAGFVRVEEDANEDELAEDGADGAFDAAAFVDRTPMSDVVDDIESGDYDEHLDEIAAAEQEGRDREGVKEAAEARR